MTTESNNSTTKNLFLDGPLALLFAKTAAPIILIMAANGLFTLVDAYYLGIYVSTDALTAVTLMFPVYMLLVGVSTLVSSGYSSVFARLLGAQSTLEASHAIGGAIVLSLCVSLVFTVSFLIFGEELTQQLANGNEVLAQLGYGYISILVFFSPAAFILGLSIDTLRCEGRMTSMLAVTLVSTLLNFVFNYLFIVELNWGVAGSAYGTVAAQICALAVAISLRLRSESKTQIRFSGFSTIRNYWGEIIKLGIPSSFSYAGLSLTAVIVLYSLQKWGTDSYSATAGAYGIITRLMTFTFLPLLGLSMALQTIVGNNYGASNFDRSTRALKIALLVSAIYCTAIQSYFYVFKSSLGFIFVDDANIAAEIARILPINTMLLFLFGPILMISTYFQSIGKAIQAAILGLSRTYLFVIPLLLILPFTLGEIGIWYAGPLAELFMLALTVAVLLFSKKSNG